MIKDSVIVITGASRGIGKAMALTFSKKGAKVVLAARSMEVMKSFSHKLPSPYLILETDVCSEISVKNMIEATVKKFGRIDVLINNAGFVEPLGVMDTSIDIWEKTMRTNLTGTFLCTREALRHMKKTGGKIFFIASTSGTGPRPGWCAYAASKAGVINFSMSMAEELRSYNIKVFCICPGGTATDLRKKLVPDEDPTTIMQPQSVVNIVEFCLNNAADVLEAQPIIIRY
ncbi:MAG: SDR family NAD(P)-dependent oxidoreductase [Bacteroidetes bacterium]|nr:SDR family NAD(P)-dependent oxidoreductase [Bacteroidota bacterium]